VQAGSNFVFNNRISGTFDPINRTRHTMCTRGLTGKNQLPILQRAEQRCEWTILQRIPLVRWTYPTGYRRIGILQLMKDVIHNKWREW